MRISLLTSRLPDGPDPSVAPLVNQPEQPALLPLSTSTSTSTALISSSQTQCTAENTSYDIPYHLPQILSSSLAAVPNGTVSQLSNAQFQYSATETNDILYPQKSDAYFNSNSASYMLASDGAFQQSLNTEFNLNSTSTTTTPAVPNGIFSQIFDVQPHLNVAPPTASPNGTHPHPQVSDPQPLYSSRATDDDAAILLDSWKNTAALGPVQYRPPVPFDPALWTDPSLCGDFMPLSDPTIAALNGNGLTSSPMLPSDSIPLTVSLPASSNTCIKRKRRQANEQELNQIKRIRKRGACLRCRLYRMKVSISQCSAPSFILTLTQCDEGSPCQNCLKVRDTAKIFKQPCEAINMKDIVPFRPGSSRTGKLRSEMPVFSWSTDAQVREITVSPLIPGISRSNLPSLQIKCRLHHDTPKHILEEAFESIDKREFILIKFPPYACVS